MNLTPKQIRCSIMNHKRRIEQLRTWYQDEHPLIQLHLRHIDHLLSLLPGPAVS